METDYQKYLRLRREYLLKLKEKEEQMKVTLRNGVTLEGTYDQVSALARQLGETVAFDGDGIHYDSSTKGLIRIATMDTQHLRNALLKRYASFVTNLRGYDNNKVAAEISNPSDKTLVGLMAEFSRRKIAGRL